MLWRKENVKHSKRDTKQFATVNSIDITDEVVGSLVKT